MRRRAAILEMAQDSPHPSVVNMEIIDIRSGLCLGELMTGQTRQSGFRMNM